MGVDYPDSNRQMSFSPAESDLLPGYLDGQLLLAMPGMQDERFARSVIYLCAIRPKGRWGLCLTRPAPDLNMPDLLVQLEIIPEEQRIQLPPEARPMQVLIGGPVETTRGFVLHSPDFHMAQSTLPIDDGVCLTATIDILRASREARARKPPSWHWAMRAGRRGQLETRSSPMAGSIVRPMRI